MPILVSACKISLNTISPTQQASDPAAENHAPASSNLNLSGESDQAIDVQLEATDADVSDTLTYTVTSNPSHGTLSGTAPNLQYQPQTGYSGSDSFTYVANDGISDSDPSTVSIEITDYCSVGSRQFDSPFAGGSGTVSDPYQICSDTQFMAISTQLDKHFELRNEINMAVPLYSALDQTWTCTSDGAGGYYWADTTTGFTGSIEGHYHRVNYFEVDGAGLVNANCVVGINTANVFASVSNATISGVIFENALLHNSSYSSSLFGTVTGSTIRRVGVSGSFTSSESGSALAMSTSNSQISEIYSNVNSFSTYGGGAVIGHASNSQISNSYAFGSYSGNDQYATTGSGGFIGVIDTNTSVTNSYSRVNLTDGGSVSLGSLFGTAASGLSITGLFWDANLSAAGITSTYSGTSYGTGLTTTAAKTKSTYTNAGWDESIWILQNGSYPKLRWEP